MVAGTRGRHLRRQSEGEGLAIIVVNYGSTALLSVNLVLVHQEQPRALIVVVDNYTTDTERDELRELAARNYWKLVEPKSNLGFGGGVNAGVSCALLASDITHLLILNPDATIDAAGVTALRVRTHESPLALVGPYISKPDGSRWSSGHLLVLPTGEGRALASDSPLDDSRMLPWISGACLVLTRELWLAVRGFDESYFLYWEDIDLCHRVREAGGSVVFEPRAVAVHDEGATHQDARSRGANAKSPTYYYYNVANRLRFAALHLSDDSKRDWLSSAPGASWQILLRGGRRQFLRPVRPLRAALRGYWAGRRLIQESLRGRRKLKS